MNILNLPTDVLLHVFSFLPPLDLAGGVRGACKTWNLLSYDRSLWKNINLYKFGLHDKFSASSFISFLSGICGHVQTLDLGRSTLDSDGYLHEDIHCSNLQEINLFGSAITEECTVELLNKYKHLTSLDLSLNIKSTRLFSAVLEQLSGLENLKSLTVHNCSIDEHSQDRLDKLLLVYKTHNCMESLSFVHCDLPCNLYLKIIQIHPNLCEISFILCGQLHRGVFQQAAALKQLKKLNLADTKCDDSVLTSVSGKAPYLEYVCLSACGSFITDTGISYMAERCIYITTLIVSRTRYDNSSVTNVGLESVAYFCKNLHKLIINYCSGISDTGVIAISNGCKNLEVFEIAGCTALSDAAVLCLVKNCPRLSRIKLTECVQITSLSINVVVTKLKHLKYLNLETCHRLSNLCFRMVKSENIPCGAKREKKINKLNEAGPDADSDLHDNLGKHVIGDSTRVKSTEDGDIQPEMTIDKCTYVSERDCELTNLIRGQREFHSHMFNLYLGFCSNISVTCIHHVASFCPDLRELTLQGCSFITDDSVHVLVKSCKALSKLNISGGSVNQTSRLTDKTLHFIAEECENLLHLVICKNHNITAKGVFDVICQCPNISLVSVSIGDRTNISIPTLKTTFSGIQSKLVKLEKFGETRVDIYVYVNKGVERKDDLAV